MCWNPQNRACFSKMIDLRGHMARLTLKNEHFPMYLLRNARNVYCNHQERVHFSVTINLRGHMTRFSWKNEHFSINLLGNWINGWWNSQHRAHFSKTINLRGHMPRFTLKMTHWKQHKCVLKPSEQGSFLWDEQFEHKMSVKVKLPFLTTTCL